MFAKLFNCKKPKVIPNFNDLQVKRIVTDDMWNNIKLGEITKDYYYNNKLVAYIIFRLNGQIGMFYVDSEYRNFGIGKKILNDVILELKEHKVPYVFAITKENHYFWHNVYNKGFTYTIRPHHSVTGDGYMMYI